MAVTKLVSIKSVIKGHNVYRVSYSCGTKFDCFLEPENQRSNTRKGGTTVGHIPEGLCQPCDIVIQRKQYC